MSGPTYMTAADLIEALQRVPPNTAIATPGYEGGWDLVDAVHYTRMGPHEEDGPGHYGAREETHWYKGERSGLLVVAPYKVDGHGTPFSGWEIGAEDEDPNGDGR